MRKIIQYFKFCLSYTEGYKKWIVLEVILKIINLGLSLWLPLLYAHFISVIADKLKTAAISLLLVIVAIQICTLFISYLTNRIENFIIKNISAFSQKRIFNQILSLPPDYLTDYDDGSIYTIVMRDSTMPITYLFTIINTLFSVITILGIGAMILSLSWQLFLVILITYPFVIIINRIFGKKLLLKQTEWIKVSDKFIGFFKNIFVSINFIKENIGNIKVQNEFDYNVDNVKVKNSELEVLKINNDIMINIIGIISYFIVNILGILFVISNRVLFSSFIAFSTYSTKFTSSLDSLVSLNAKLQPTFVILQRLERLNLLYKQFIEENQTKMLVGVNQNAINIEKLSISLSNHMIFENVNLKIVKGHVIKIIGRNGCGKTTLLKILKKELTKFDGSIKFDDIDLNDIEYNSIQNILYYLRQTPPMLQLSLYDNLTLFDAYNSLSKEEVIKACKQVDLWNDIKDLPDGLDTKISNNFNLSAGQIQKLQFARAILKNAPILLIDEITANLDKNSTKIILDLCKNMKRSGKTIIFISHTDSPDDFIDDYYTFTN